VVGYVHFTLSLSIEAPANKPIAYPVTSKIAQFGDKTTAITDASSIAKHIIIRFFVR
jgi:hypothetical protein